MAAEAVRAAAATGDGFAAGVEYGPLNNAAQYARVAELVDDAKASGATILAGEVDRWVRVCSQMIDWGWKQV